MKHNEQVCTDDLAGRRGGHRIGRPGPDRLHLLTNLEVDGDEDAEHNTVVGATASERGVVRRGSVTVSASAVALLPVQLESDADFSSSAHTIS